MLVFRIEPFMYYLTAPELHFGIHMELVELFLLLSFNHRYSALHFVLVFLNFVLHYAIVYFHLHHPLYFRHVVGDHCRFKNRDTPRLLFGLLVKVAPFTFEL